MKIYVITEIRMGYGWVPKEKEFFNIIKKTQPFAVIHLYCLDSSMQKKILYVYSTVFISVNVCTNTDIT